MAHQPKRVFRSREILRLVIIAAAVFATAYTVLNNVSHVRTAASAEARFTDTSPSGLAVVPASGGSESYYQAYYQAYYQGYYEAYYQAYYEGYYQAYYEAYYQASYPPSGTYAQSYYQASYPPSGTYAQSYYQASYPPGGGTGGGGTGGGGTGTGNPGGTNDPVDPKNPVTCWDGSTAPASGSCPACPAGYSKVGNTCVPPQPPQFVGFRTADGFNASGHLEVRPSLGRSGYVAKVYWNVTNVKDCTVRGSNGDGSPSSSTGVWNTFASGLSGKSTTGITSRTDYTLFCHSLTGATPSTITETRTVNVLPSWYEPSGS